MVVAAGSRVSHYRLIDKLGEGAWASCGAPKTNHSIARSSSPCSCSRGRSSSIPTSRCSAPWRGTADPHLHEEDRSRSAEACPTDLASPVVARRTL